MYMSKLRGDFIMTTKKVQLEEPMMKVNLGGWGVEYLLPWNDAVQVLTLMRSAIRVESEYKDNKHSWKRHKGEPIKAEAFSPEQLAQVLMSGEPS
jgi:hypothetical protein